MCLLISYKAIVFDFLHHPRSEVTEPMPILNSTCCSNKKDSIKEKEEGKGQSRNQYNYIPHLTLETIWEIDKNTRKDHIQELVSPPPAGDHKAARNRQDSITKTNMKHKEDPH